MLGANTFWVDHQPPKRSGLHRMNSVKRSGRCTLMILTLSYWLGVFCKGYSLTAIAPNGWEDDE